MGWGLYLLSFLLPLGLFSSARETPKEIHFENGSWSIEGQKLWPELFNGENGQKISSLGNGVVGRHAHIVVAPENDHTYVLSPRNIFPFGRLGIPLGADGAIYLDSAIYKPIKVKVNGLGLRILSEVSNPAIATTITVFQTLTSLFPFRTSELKHAGSVRVALLQNKTESFQTEPLDGPMGYHFSKTRTLYEVSQDGLDPEILTHLFHEAGGLFKIRKNVFAHGLSWMIAYDYTERGLSTEKERAIAGCHDLGRTITTIRNTAIQNDQKDFSHSMEYHIIDVDNRNGYPLFAWGSAFYWLLIDRSLRAQNKPTVYDLVNYLHKTDPSALGDSGDLDKILKAYQDLSPSNSGFFKSLVLKYFRDSNLGDLVTDLLNEFSQKDCDQVLH